MRVTNSVARKKRHKKFLSLTKGYRWGRSNLYRLAKNASTKAGQHAYVGRKRKKRDFRRLWITRISIALRNRGLKYSDFMFKLSEKAIFINRKILADFAVLHVETFDRIIKKAYS